MTHKKYTIGQSFAGYIREHLPDIEQKLTVGIRYVTLHKGFVAMGFDVTLDTMRGALYRARLARDGVKSRKVGGVAKVNISAPKTTAAATNAVTPAKDYFARESVFSQRKG
jgi:hypothetical protein